MRMIRFISMFVSALLLSATPVWAQYSEGLDRRPVAYTGHIIIAGYGGETWLDIYPDGSDLSALSCRVLFKDESLHPGVSFERRTKIRHTNVPWDKGYTERENLEFFLSGPWEERRVAVEVNTFFHGSRSYCGKVRIKWIQPLLVKG